jgi:hypothetical protein
MADSNYSNCQVCGQKLTSAIFCLPCKASFCSQKCYQVHKAKHTAEAPGLDRGKRPGEGKSLKGG